MARLKDILAQILILAHIGQMLAHVVFVHHDLGSGHFRSVKADVGKDLFHDGVEPAGTNVLGGSVDFLCKGGDFLQAVLTEAQAYAFCAKQSRILLCEGIGRLLLLCEGIGRLLQDTQKLVLAQGFEFHAQGKAAL